LLQLSYVILFPHAIRTNAIIPPAAGVLFCRCEHQTFIPYRDVSTQSHDSAGLNAWDG